MDAAIDVLMIAFGVVFIWEMYLLVWWRLRMTRKWHVKLIMRDAYREIDEKEREYRNKNRQIEVKTRSLLFFLIFDFLASYILLHCV